MTIQHTPFWHYGMLRDTDRTQFYEDIIKKNCAGKTILEIGSGSGLLSALTLQYGAKHVYAVEQNILLAECSKKLIQRLNLENRFTLFEKNSMKLLDSDLPKVDIILHEIFGSDPFGEFVVPALSDAKRFLKPDGILLPESIYLTFRPKQFKAPEPLVYKDINLQEVLDIFTTQYPHLNTTTHAEDDFLFITGEIKLSELIDNQNFKAQVTSEKFINAKIFPLHSVEKGQGVRLC